MEKNEIKKLEKLDMKNVFGKAYTIASIAMIVISVAFGILIGLTNISVLSIIFISLALIYLIGLLISEVIRNRIVNRNKEQNSAI